MRTKADKYDKEYIQFKVHGGKFKDLSPELQERLKKTSRKNKESGAQLANFRKHHQILRTGKLFHTKQNATPGENTY